MTEPDRPFDIPAARQVWETRYRDGAAEASLRATWQRVAYALAKTEASDRDGWECRFLDILQDFQFLPGGRILAGAGVNRDVTLFNCFVMGTIDDSIEGIFRALEEGAVTMQQGGGVGYDFSTLPPSGTPSHPTGSIAAGPVPFMDVWEAMCATVQSTCARRGAMMATLRCDHPDILAFVDAKRRPDRLRHFNLSVLVTDAFMRAVERDEDWPLRYPEAGAAHNAGAERQVRARGLWDSLLRASYDTGEPGVLFIDRINRLNNLGYCEHITATNPCGEVPLPPYGACDLGAINLTQLIRDPFTPSAHLDTARLTTIAATAVRLLDDVIDISHFPLPQQQMAVRKARRVGLGITGLADALVMLGMRYGDDVSLTFGGATMRTICHAAYRASIDLAREKGRFPDFDRRCYLEAPFIQTLPADIRDGIARHGIRNSHLLAIAPTGTISLLAGNISSGIEPVYAPEYRRSIRDAGGVPREFLLDDYAVRLWRRRSAQCDSTPDALVTAAQLPIEAHLAMQARLQEFVDNSISKTVNVPAGTAFADFAPIYRLAYQKGLKGCTTFRSVTTREALLAPIQGSDVTSGSPGKCL